MMKKILLPTDFSKNAWNAIDYALHFFSNEKCTFYLLNAYTPSFYRVDYMFGGPAQSAIPDNGINLSSEGLEYALKRIKKEYKNHNHQFKTISAFNTLTDEVHEVCKDKNIDMMVMGTQGASGAKEFFLGSNTVHVLRKAPVPVLAVPTEYRFKEVNKILLPTDYWSKYKPNEIGPLIDLLKQFNATLHVVHVVEDHDLTQAQLKNKEHLAHLLADVPTEFHDITDAYMPNGVHTYMEKNAIGLIAMMNRKHSFLERLMLKQNVDAVGYHSAVPFLVLPDTAEISKIGKDEKYSVAH